MYNPFTVGRRLRLHRQQIEALTQEVNEKQAQLLAREALIKELKRKIRDLEFMAQNPPFLRAHSQAAQIRVLEVKTVKGINFQLAGAIFCALLAGVALVRGRMLSRPVEMPSFPETDVYTYRIYDEQESVEREVGERELKELLKKRAIV